MIGQLADFHFIRPGWLLLAPLVIGLWWLWRRHSDPLRGWRAQLVPEMLEALVVGRESGSGRPAQLVLLCWLAAIVAIAGPTWRLEPSPFADDATPLMILLKSDSSMETPDPAPSRLERAHLKITDLAEARKGQPLGLVAYAGSAHLVLPPTRDTAVVAQMAAEISPEIMPTPGDRLDLALREANRILVEGQQSGSILVLADAVDTDAASLQSVANDLSFPVQFLAVNTPESSQNDSLRAGARTLNASVEALDFKGEDDVTAIVRRAASAPVAQRGEQGERWQEAGYWLVPLVAFLLAASFRREQPREAK